MSNQVLKLSQMGPKWPYFEVFGKFLKFESLVLAGIEYSDTELWYLAFKQIGPKIRVLANILNYVHVICSMLHFLTAFLSQ